MSSPTVHKANPKSSDLTVSAATLLDAMISYDISSQWQALKNIYLDVTIGVTTDSLVLLR